MKRSLKFVALLAIISMVVMMGLPALAKGGKGKGKGQENRNRGGKKAVGVVTAYDSAANLLTAAMKDGSTFSGTVAEDVQVKLDHRGNNGENKRKKPSNGDESDILVDAEILKMKVTCDEVTKLRLRAGTGVETVEEPAEEEATQEESGEEVVTDPATEGDAGLTDTVTDPLLRMATEDESATVEDDTDDCAAEETEESSEEGSDELGEGEGADGSTSDGSTTDGSSGTSDGSSGTGDGSSGVGDIVDCVVTELEDCV